MNRWAFLCCLVLVIGLFPIDIVAGNTLYWSYQRPYSSVDLIDKNEDSIGYHITAPITYPNEMVRVSTENETRWGFDLEKAGKYNLTYVPHPQIASEDEFFEIHERDISFIGHPFDEENLYYDGSVYSAWGDVGESRIRYDCARFIDGDFFKLSCIFDSIDEALRYNQKLREIINTLEKNS